jgi:hypothetical protein
MPTLFLKKKCLKGAKNSSALPGATIFSRHSQSGPTNSFFVEPVCRTQNSRVTRPFPANDLAVTFGGKCEQRQHGKFYSHTWPVEVMGSIRAARLR